MTQIQKTQVVNIRYHEYDQYMGRAGKGQDGYFGNPIQIGKFCPECGHIHQNRGETIPCYQVYFYKRIKSDKEFNERIELLRGKKLGCFCKLKDLTKSPQPPCHCDVIINYLGNNDDKSNS